MPESSHMLTDDYATDQITRHTQSPVKSRIVSVRLLSMAMTGFFYQFTRPRTSPPMSMLKYDPIGTAPARPLDPLSFNLPP
ncbi:hypothetical protein INS49_009756 [Diaporthe citri]|uniref:uncharacterized protein n=1 Tax=Diaporthe citri TaxID=83186 RepID=UPI001C8056D8|nr:uncharacterized protein INS49_009756 [Diaporthe citri]KAG6361529.1 hypothetical protein INS49_009756 [Diaporthe citri]